MSLLKIGAGVSRIATVGLGLWVFFALVGGTPALSATWRVEQDGTGQFLSIQPAVDVAAAGDTILIGPGNYNQAQSIYIPSWNATTDVFVEVTVPGLVFVGTNPDEVFVGPDSYYPTYFGPIGMFEDEQFAEPWYVENITFRNCYTGLYALGAVAVTNCHFIHNMGHGVFSSRGRCAVSGSYFEDNKTGVRAHQCMELQILDSTIVRSHCYLAGSVDLRLAGSCFQGSVLTFYGSSGRITECTGTNSQIEITVGGIASVISCNFAMPGYAALVVTDMGSATVDSSIFTSDLYPVTLYGGAQLTAQNSHFLNSSGPGNRLVNCESYATGWTTIDLKNNYWGTNDSAEIAAGIWDNNDDPALKVIVEFEPFASGPVPGEKRSWGDVKAMFR